MVVKGKKNNKNQPVADRNKITDIVVEPKSPEEIKKGPLFQKVKHGSIPEFDLFDIRLVKRNDGDVTKGEEQQIQVEAVHQAIKEINKLIVAVNKRNRGTTKKQIPELTLDDFEATSYTRVGREDGANLDKITFFPVDMQVKEEQIGHIRQNSDIKNLSINIDDPSQQISKSGKQDNSKFQVSSISNNKSKNTFFFWFRFLYKGSSCWLCCSI